jgi:hypothetical protein
MRRRSLFHAAALLSALLLGAPAAVQAGTQAVQGKPGVAGQWRVIGQTHASHTADHDAIFVQGPYDKFRRIKFKVTDAPLNLYRMVVTYDNGAPDKIEVRQNIAKGGDSRTGRCGRRVAEADARQCGRAGGRSVKGGRLPGVWWCARERQGTGVHHRSESSLGRGMTSIARRAGLDLGDIPTTAPACRSVSVVGQWRASDCSGSPRSLARCSGPWPHSGIAEKED